MRSGTAASRRLQTSLALYSSELAAVVLLCDSPPPRLAPPTTLLAAAAQAATEHHFADVDAQLRLVAERVKGPVSLASFGALASAVPSAPKRVDDGFTKLAARRVRRRRNRLLKSYFFYNAVTGRTSRAPDGTLHAYP